MKPPVKKAFDVNEQSGIQFSLSFLIQVLATVCLAVWGYSQLDARISTVTNSLSTAASKIHTIETDLKENQDKPIPSDHVQNTKLFAHERELMELKTRIAVLETRLYSSRARLDK
jgi:SPX domain protein involved in polyphosphate accumulation